MIYFGLALVLAGCSKQTTEDEVDGKPVTPGTDTNSTPEQKLKENPAASKPGPAGKYTIKEIMQESFKQEGNLKDLIIEGMATAEQRAQFIDYVEKTGMDPKILIVGFPNFEDCRQRVDGFASALNNAGLTDAVVQEVDGQGLKEKAFKAAQDALTAHPDINVIYGINDDSTTGAMAAYRAAGLDENELVAIGFGFEGSVGRNALLSNTPYKSALAMFPHFVGACIVDAAIALANGDTLPDHYETPTVMMTQENFDQFYSSGEYEGYAIKMDAVRKLMSEAL